MKYAKGIFPYSVFYFFMIAILGCDNKGSSQQKDIFPDSVLAEIPIDRTGKPISGYLFARAMEKKVELGNLTDEKDTVEIRIWYSFSETDTVEALVLKYHIQRGWRGKFYTCKFSEHNNKVDTVVSVASVNPRSGWNYFVGHLFKLGIFNLPHMDMLVGNSFDILHGNVYTVEYTVNGKYRLYQYVDPANFRDKWSEATNMENILVLIEDQFAHQVIK